MTSTKEPAFLVIDLEATNREPEKAHVVEWGLVVYTPPAPILGVSEDFYNGGTALVRPPVTIPPETSAVHHIIDEDVADARDWSYWSGQIREDIQRYQERRHPVYLVAHNASLENHFIAPLAVNLPWIDTYKCALRAWPDAPSHSNEGLRYCLNLNGIGRSFVQKPHTALHDANVTALILQQLLHAQPLETLLQWSAEGAILPRCPIGAYRGLKWGDVPTDFLEWILYRAVNMRADVMNTARFWYEKRYRALERDSEDEDEEDYSL